MDHIKYYELYKVKYEDNKGDFKKWLKDSLNANNYPVFSYNYKWELAQEVKAELECEGLSCPAFTLFKLLCESQGSTEALHSAYKIAANGCLTAIDVINHHIIYLKQRYQCSGDEFLGNYIEDMPSPIFNKLCGHLTAYNWDIWRLHQKVKNLEARIAALEYAPGSLKAKEAEDEFIGLVSIKN